MLTHNLKSFLLHRWKQPNHAESNHFACQPNIIKDMNQFFMIVSLIFLQHFVVVIVPIWLFMCECAYDEF